MSEASETLDEIATLAARLSAKFSQMSNPAAIQVVLETVLRNIAVGKPSHEWMRSLLHE